METLQKKYMLILIYIIPIILVIIFFILFINRNNELHQAANRYKNDIERLNKEKKDLIADYQRKEKLFEIVKNFNINNISLNDYYIKQMKKKGLTNPVDNIISDLQKHPELIPYKGVYGGRMGFYDKDEIWVLTYKWVFAYFEDGHISGYLLLEYNITDDGKIHWKKIASMRG